MDDSPYEPWWTDEKKAMRVFATVGALITISGVGLLVALGIQRGVIGIVAQMTLAYLLGAALIGAAVLVQRKWAHAIGTSALMITGVTTAHITTTYISGSLDWWPVWFGIILILAVGSIGLVTGSLWQLRTLSLLTALSTIIAALVTYEYDLGLRWVLAATVAFAFATGLSWWRRPDMVIFITSAVASLMMSAGMLSYATDDLAGILIITVTIVGSAGILAATYFHEKDPAATVLAVVLAGFTGPVISTSHITTWAPAIGAAFSLLIGGAWLYIYLQDEHTLSDVSSPMASSPSETDEPRSFALTVAQSGLIAAAAVLLFLGVDEPNALWTAPVTAGFAVVAVTLVLKRWEFFIPLLVVWFAAGHMVLVDVIPYLFSDVQEPLDLLRHAQMNLTQYLPASLFLLIGDAALIVLAIQKGKPLWDDMRKVAGLVGLLFIAAPVVLLMQSLGLPFALGHILVSIGWMLAAAFLLLKPSSGEDKTDIGGAVLIAAVAVVKLVFFDLSALSGVLRVIVFIACGLLLLAMAVLRSRRSQPEYQAPAGKEMDTGTGTDGDIDEWSVTPAAYPQEPPSGKGRP